MCLYGDMTDVFWSPDRTAAAGERANYSVVLCVETNDTLYVVVDNPEPNRETTEFVKMEASVPDVGMLPWLGQSSSSQKRGQILVGRFDPPPADSPVIEIRMTLDEVPVFVQSALRRSLA
jgi:hypothetical protein